jgi:hypothetical protein
MALLGAGVTGAVYSYKMKVLEKAPAGSAQPAAIGANGGSRDHFLQADSG